jgi:hypothetical protein
MKLDLGERVCLHRWSNDLARYLHKEAFGRLWLTLVPTMHGLSNAVVTFMYFGRWKP